MSEPESHDHAEPFDPTEHLGPHEGDHVEPLDNLEGLFDEPMGHRAEPISEPFSEPFIAPEPIAPRMAPASKPAPAKPTYVAPSQPKQAGLPAIVTVAGSALIMLGGAYGLSTMIPKPEPAPANATAPAAAKPDAAPSGTAVAAAPASDESKVLTTRVDELSNQFAATSKRLDDIQKAMESLPKPGPTPDLKPIEAKIAEVAKKVETAPGAAADTKPLEESVAKAHTTLTDLNAKLDAITAKSADLEKALASQKDAVAALSAKVDASASKPPQGTSTTTIAGPAPAADADFGKAVDLFKKAQYPQAKDVFTKLQSSTPDDARVWYYSALANGMTTNQWNDGETVRLVTKGIDLEKAGKPEATEISSALEGIPASLKPWIDAYRARAK